MLLCLLLSSLYITTTLNLTLNIKTMTKKELVNAIAKNAEITIKDAGKALDAFVKEFGKAMAKGEKIQLLGLGTFKVEKKSARTARNPRTGAVIKVPAKKVVKFKAANSLNQSL